MSDRFVFHNFKTAPTHVAPFSHAVECDGWIQLTGQMPTDPDDDNAALPEGVAAQTSRVIDNLVIVLENLGLGLGHVMSCRIERDYETMNKVYRDYFTEDRLPARTCIGVTALARQALVEIDMVARR